MPLHTGKNTSKTRRTIFSQQAPWKALPRSYGWPAFNEYHPRAKTALEQERVLGLEAKNHQSGVAHGEEQAADGFQPDPYRGMLLLGLKQTCHGRSAHLQELCKSGCRSARAAESSVRTLLREPNAHPPRLNAIFPWVEQEYRLLGRRRQPKRLLQSLLNSENDQTAKEHAVPCPTRRHPRLLQRGPGVLSLEDSAGFQKKTRGLEAMSKAPFPAKLSRHPE